MKTRQDKKRKRASLGDKDPDLNEAIVISSDEDDLNTFVDKWIAREYPNFSKTDRNQNDTSKSNKGELMSLASYFFNLASIFI